MKNPDLDAPIGALRRKLMPGLPGGLALSAPVALPSVARIGVAVPAGSGTAAASTSLITANNSAAVAADGTRSSPQRTLP